MKKIIAGILGIVLILSVTGGTAYALFSSTATVSNVAFTTGNANLTVGIDGQTYASNLDVGSVKFNNLFPKAEDTYQFSLKNESTSPISLSLAAKLNNGVTESLAGSWNTLKDVVSVSFDYYDGSSWIPAGFATLNQWNAAGYGLDGGVLAPDASRWYKMHVKVADADNSIAGKGINNVVFTFTGTQAP